MAQRNRSAALRRNFLQPARFVRSFWKPRGDPRCGCYRRFPGNRPGFGESRKKVRRGNTVEAVANAYLEFAASSPALYEVMFSLSLSVPFDDRRLLRRCDTHFLNCRVVSRAGLEVRGYIRIVLGEPSRYRRAHKDQATPPSRQKERVKTLVELFTCSNGLCSCSGYRACLGIT